MALSFPQKNVYVPYSHAEQWCIVEGSNGELYSGVRVENASFPLTISAVQVAIFSCLSEADKPTSIYLPAYFQDNRLDYLVEYHHLGIHSINELPDKPVFQVASKPHKSPRETLESLMKQAIVAESNFQVACILELDNGNWITGVNIEYPDWQIGLCAERVAICKAIANGCIDQVKSIHITASSGSFISPCGACRQVLVEHIPYKTIHLYHPDRTESATTAAQLLPAFFNGSPLRK